MFSTIRTSRANKDLVTHLTNKLNLGAENVIARLAFSYSLNTNRKLSLNDMKDAGGKEYNSKVLFGSYADIYMALLCVHYNLYKSDKDLARYVKLHIDDGLELINKEVEAKDSITGNDFIINEIEKGLLSFESLSNTDDLNVSY